MDIKFGVYTKIYNLETIALSFIDKIIYSVIITFFCCLFYIIFTIILGKKLRVLLWYAYPIIILSFMLGYISDYTTYFALRDNGYAQCEDLVGFDPSDEGTTYGRSIEACLSVVKRTVPEPEQAKQFDSPTTEAAD